MSVRRFGVFELDPATGELRRSGLAVRLQPQAQRVLMALLEQPGQVVTREELRRALWGDHTFVDFDRSLNFCLSRLRAALGDDARRPRFVETVPGRGYRFIAPVALPASRAPAPVSPVVRARLRRWPAAAALVAVALLAAPVLRERAIEPDAVAQALYAEARSLCGPDGWRRSVGLYQAACARQPRYAAAHAGMAESYLALAEDGVLEPRQAFPAARDAARRALAVADRGDARLVLGRALLAYDWDWAAAERELSRGLALEPGSARAWVAWSRYLSARGHAAAALGAAQRAESLDPGSLEAIEEVAWCQYRARRFEAAVRQFRLVAARRPVEGHHRLFEVLRVSGRDQEAKREAVAVMRQAGVDPAQVAAVERLEPRRAGEAYLRGMMAFLRAEDAARRVAPERLALLHAALGEAGAAMDRLAEAAAQRSSALLTTLVDPALDGLRGDPRFVSLARRVGSRAASPQAEPDSSEATSSAMASAEVSPGESMPTRLTKPGSPRADSSAITKSRKPWPGPGPWSLARIPAMSGSRSSSATPGTRRRTAAPKAARLPGSTA
jgi:DNA-binding winged helix-turn-helix (wHTH) protein